MRNAMEKARQELAAQKLKARIVAYSEINTSEATEYNFQEIEGLLENTVIVASYTDGSPDDPHFLTRESYALACMQGKEAKVPGSLNKDVPEWVRAARPAAWRRPLRPGHQRPHLEQLGSGKGRPPKRCRSPGAHALGSCV